MKLDGLLRSQRYQLGHIAAKLCSRCPRKAYVDRKTGHVYRLCKMHLESDRARKLHDYHEKRKEAA